VRASSALSPRVSAEPGAAQFDALGEGLAFATRPFAAVTEITGPAAARLFAASSGRARNNPRTCCCR
jgi:hypothetical protein